MSTPPIWMYWAGPMPEYIAFCTETVRAWHPGRVRFVGEVAMQQALDDAGIPRGKQAVMTVQHQADVLRAWLLADAGGYWVDCDYLAFAPIDGIAPPEAHFAAAVQEGDDERIDNDFVFAAPGSPVAAEFWTQLQRTLWFNDFTVPSWSTLGANILTSLMHMQPEGAYRIPIERVSWSRKLMLQLDTHLPNEISDTMLGDSIGAMLIHSESGKYLAHRSFDDIIKSPTIVGALFRAAIRRLTSD